MFLIFIRQVRQNSGDTITRKDMEPYKAGWNGDINKLYEGSTFSCKTGNRHYCTAIIQDNGWKIPDDYPYKVSY